ncbi:MAG TPA: GNAT family N-acyltransferase [Micromonosporaceae bacterium]
MTAAQTLAAAKTLTAAPILAATPAPVATAGAPAPAGYQIAIATSPDEIRAAQRLRHEVFASEFGAQLTAAEPGLDVDGFDPICDHLIVRDNRTAEVVGTYRMLPPHRAAGTLYADGEFDLTCLAPLRDVLVETGRSCVHPDHRGGAVINLMWTGIARYLHLHGYRWLVGCASVSLADGGANADAVWQVVRDNHLAPPRLRVAPRRPYPCRPVDRDDRTRLRSAVPPLLRGYLRLGAWVCGAPAHDPAFNVADFLVLLSLDRVDPRYLSHFLGAA